MTIEQAELLLAATNSLLDATRAVYAAVCVLVGVGLALILAVTWKG